MYEYETVTVKQKDIGLFGSRSIAELDEVLNTEARNGWALKEIISPSGYEGERVTRLLLFSSEKFNHRENPPYRLFTKASSWD